MSRGHKPSAQLALGCQMLDLVLEQPEAQAVEGRPARSLMAGRILARALLTAAHAGVANSFELFRGIGLALGDDLRTEGPAMQEVVIEDLIAAVRAGIRGDAAA